MKIVHISPNSPYNEGWGYQENLLPKYQAKLKNDVTLIVTTHEHCDGGIIDINETDYMSKDGFRVIRKKQNKIINRKFTDFFARLNIYNLLIELNPDFVFYHGFESITIFQVMKYKQQINPKLVIVQDNHADYNLGYSPKDGLKASLFCLKNRIVFNKTKKYIDRIYGVTPWRKTYVEDVIGVPSSMTNVLLMGADDDKVDLFHKEEIRKRIRDKYFILDSDYLIVTGGKIDCKKNIDILMEACQNRQQIKLLIFGSISNDIKDKFTNILNQSNNIIYIGWVNSIDVYDYFFAADLVFFPGQHSVLWEQACASKVPCVFKKWEGMDHVNNGGNSELIDPINISNIEKTIKNLFFTEKYFKMKSIAESDATNIYMYSNIAKKSLEAFYDNENN